MVRLNVEITHDEFYSVLTQKNFHLYGYTLPQIKAIIAELNDAAPHRMKRIKKMAP